MLLKRSHATPLKELNQKKKADYRNGKGLPYSVNDLS